MGPRWDGDGTEMGRICDEMDGDGTELGQRLDGDGDGTEMG